MQKLPSVLQQKISVYLVTSRIKLRTSLPHTSQGFFFLHFFEGVLGPFGLGTFLVFSNKVGK